MVIGGGFIGIGSIGTGRGCLAAGLLALTMLSRLPGLISARMYDVDESYLAAMGMTMGRGGQLYIDALDRKPPLLPWLYSLSERMLGTVDLRMLRWLLVLGIAASAIVVARIVLQIGGSRRGAAAAGLLLVLGTVAFLPADGQAANFELFALLPACAAVWVALAARDRSLLPRLLSLAAAGALVGIAGMVKQPLFAMLAPVGCVVWQRRPRLVGALAAALGLVVGVVASGLPFGLGRVWEWAWVQTSDFLDGQVGGWRVLEVLVVVAAVFAALHGPALVTTWRRRSQFRQVDSVVWWWLIGAVDRDRSRPAVHLPLLPALGAPDRSAGWLALVEGEPTDGDAHDGFGRGDRCGLHLARRVAGLRRWKGATGSHRGNTAADRA